MQKVSIKQGDFHSIIVISSEIVAESFSRCAYCAIL